MQPCAVYGGGDVLKPMFYAWRRDDLKPAQTGRKSWKDVGRTLCGYGEGKTSGGCDVGKGGSCGLRVAAAIAHVIVSVVALADIKTVVRTAAAAVVVAGLSVLRIEPLTLLVLLQR
jgi:hypothetical protein